MMDQLKQTIPIDLTKKIVINEKAVEDCMREEGSTIKEKLISLTLNEDTENKLSNVRKHLHAPDNQTALRMAIALCSRLIDDQKSGREVRIREKDGRQYRLEFTRCT